MAPATTMLVPSKICDCCYIMFVKFLIFGEVLLIHFDLDVDRSGH